MQSFKCETCEKTYVEYQDLQHIDSIRNKGVCCECRADAAYCTQCNRYYFQEEAALILANESELCPKHYYQFFELHELKFKNTMSV